MAHPKTILTILATFLASYPPPNRTVDEIKLLRALWQKVLQDAPEEALQWAAQEYACSSERFMPVPGQLRERAFQIAEDEARRQRLKLPGGRDRPMSEQEKARWEEIAEQAIREMRGFTRKEDKP